jgi:hypothetical protein
MRYLFAVLVVFFFASLVMACCDMHTNPNDTFAGIVSMASLFGIVLCGLFYIERKSNGVCIQCTD